MSEIIRPTTENMSEAELRFRVDELEQQVANLQQQLDTDKKTGLYSHHYFEEKILPEIETYLSNLSTEKREGTPKLVFGVGDINAMNLINGLVGHPGGDIVLQKTANVLTHSIRDTDWVGRSGEAGDEFYLLLRVQHDVDIDHAIESFEQRINQGLRTVVDPGFSVSMSVGLVDVSQFSTIDAVRISADTIMYDRKRLWKQAQQAAGLIVSDRVKIVQT